MPVNKNAAFRYRVIDSCLRNPRRKYPTIEDIQEAVSDALNMDTLISISSLNKDMKAMRDHYKAPIKYDNFRRGYYYDDEHFSINSFPLTADEISALDLSISFLKQIKYSGFFQQFESAIEKIISGFRISKIPGFENRKLIETEEPTADTGIKWLENIYEAIVMKKVKEIEYRRFNSPDSKIHVLSPYVLREYRNRWYVTGHSELPDDVVTLALDRIDIIKDIERKFVETPDFDEHRYFTYAFGATVYPNTDPSRVQLLFQNEITGYILSKPLHSSQKVIEDPRGFIVELECYITPELEMTILSYGENVKVLCPVDLVDRIDKRIQAMSYLYRT